MKISDKSISKKEISRMKKREREYSTKIIKTLEMAILSHS